MFPFNHPPAVIVREYTSRRDMEHDARSLARRHYHIVGTTAHTAVGLPTLTHGIIHTRTTVTYALAPTQPTHHD